MELLNGSLSVVMHVSIAALLLVYLPISLVWRLLRWVLVRPFLKEDMTGKVVLITGASSGIGEQLAYEYAKRGASMALAARRERALETVSAKARELGAPDVLVIAADVSDPSEANRVVQATVARFGQLNHLVCNAGLWSTCFFEEITSITAFTRLMDVNFWGSVYPTYYALPFLKNTRGKIVVNASMGGRVPTPRMSFYNASKAAMIRFYETLRSELGSDVRITIVNLGYVASELTKGKAVQKNGEVAIDQEARDILVGPLPIGSTEKCAQLIVGGACGGDEYITWPSWYKPFHVVMSLAPEIVIWFCRCFYVGKPGNASSEPLSKRILNVKGLKRFLYPASVLSSGSVVDQIHA
ncbi:hypothetical protein OPV22_020107 [Ensete ventricosum]|uniref:3-oxoacyl-[acyl-carrier-protein] reductase n=1 Tax=Ensete ventricosum TaxID=4639 RepID=A0AAV8QM99_ENSVE|nr:hypothetical protein OPV22_020107 [Ensete ventricosum]